jgi:transcriptional regulator with GAF, ATPase, and Fis domain
VEADEPSVLLQLARLNESHGDWAAALDCLERALAAGGEPVRPSVLEAARRIGEAAPSGVRERARALETKPQGPRTPARPKTTKTAKRTPEPKPPPPPITHKQLAIARELLVTPEVVLALRNALGAKAPSPAVESASLPLERILARLLSCELDLAQVIDLCLDLVLEATGVQRGLMLARDEHGALAHKRGRGLGRADIQAALSTSILAEALRTGEPVFVNDAPRDPTFGQRESVLELGLRSVACVPIVDPQARSDPPGSDPGSLLGVVYLDDPTPERFGPGARELLRSLARLLTGPLRNAQRFEAQRTALVRARSPESSGPRGRERIVGRSKAVREMLDLLARVAKEEVPVLIQGESGTGKELAARTIHEESPRARGPFVAENLAALTPTLIEAELFGVVKGAFTGADRDRDGLFVRANGGTLFLDELGELPLEAQAKLLRVLQEREVRPLGGERVLATDARVVAATNRDLDQMVRDGSFREDLLYRLRVVTVVVPPLRERAEDIPLLAAHILERIADERGEPLAPLSRAALAKLCSRTWRGNVRELENVLWRVALTGESALDAAPPGATEEASSDGLRMKLELPGETVALDEARATFDRAYVGLVLRRSQGNVARAARALGITRPALSRMLGRLGLREPTREGEG